MTSLYNYVPPFLFMFPVPRLAQQAQIQMQQHQQMLQQDQQIYPTGQTGFQNNFQQGFQPQQTFQASNMASNIPSNSNCLLPQNQQFQLHQQQQQQQQQGFMSQSSLQPMGSQYQPSLQPQFQQQMYQQQQFQQPQFQQLQQQQFGQPTFSQQQYMQMQQQQQQQFQLQQQQQLQQQGFMQQQPRPQLIRSDSIMHSFPSNIIYGWNGMKWICPKWSRNRTIPEGKSNSRSGLFIVGVWLHALSCRTMRTAFWAECGGQLHQKRVFKQAWTLGLCFARMYWCGRDARAHLSFAEDSHPDFQGLKTTGVDPSQFSLQNCELLSFCMCRFQLYIHLEMQGHSFPGAMRMIGGSFGSCLT